MNVGQAASFGLSGWRARLLAASAFATAALSLMHEKPCRAGDDAQANAAIVRVDDWSCMFAGRETTLRYDLPRKTEIGTNVEWKVTVGDRLIARGRSRVGSVDANAADNRFSMSVKTPSLKPGLMISAKLNLECKGEGTPALECSHPVEIFSPDAFSDRLAALRELNIQLYDPREVTASSLGECKVPFTLRRTLASIDEIENGVLILGEGLDWDRQQAIPRAAVRAAQRGLIVICLAPTEGEIALSVDATNSLKSTQEIKLADDNIIHRFGPKLDTQHWPDGPSAMARFLLQSRNGNRIARISDSEAARPWLEMTTSTSTADFRRGKLMVCGFGIIKYWKSSPVPRYLLRRDSGVVFSPRLIY